MEKLLNQLFDNCIELCSMHNEIDLRITQNYGSLSNDMESLGKCVAEFKKACDNYMDSTIKTLSSLEQEVLRGVAHKDRLRIRKSFRILIYLAKTVKDHPLTHFNYMGIILRRVIDLLEEVQMKVPVSQSDITAAKEKLQTLYKSKVFI